MVNSSHSQSLLPPKTTHKTSLNHKILIFSFSLITLFSLAYLGLVFIQPHKSNPIKTPPLYEESSKSSDGKELLKSILLSHVTHINKAIDATKSVNDNNNNVLKGVQEITDCLELLDLSRDRVTDSIKSLAKRNINNNHNNAKDDITTWLSAVLTNYVTCLDQLQDHSHLLELKSMIEDLISSSRKILSIQKQVFREKESSISENNLIIRKPLYGDYPSWVRSHDKKLLEVSGSETVADVVVAKDGSGNFTTVAEAVASAPDKGKQRYVIYVKEGVYEENVEVGKKKKNVMIVGDGMNLTVITGNENVVDGNTTFRSATLAAVGDGFILQDICIQNTAGPEKHQAVALRVGADQSVINRCQINAYQDTLYAHSLRQFYAHSSISGTIDFIFGNAAVVVQNCQLIVRQPMKGQKNMVTAQGRTDPSQNTGTSIQYCDIIASSDLGPVQGQFPTFLGRPWKNFSRTVVMQSNISDVIDPQGWFEWDGDFALDTLYYGEYMNYGLGADTSKRVNWTGYHIITDVNVAKSFTVGEFIQGQQWLDSTGVSYVEGL
ncbi:Pectinesterase 2.1 [Bienertia sinuspersici]